VLVETRYGYVSSILVVGNDGAMVSITSPGSLDDCTC
jgi:hypothetical protein